MDVVGQPFNPTDNLSLAVAYLLPPSPTNPTFYKYKLIPFLPFYVYPVDPSTLCKNRAVLTIAYRPLHVEKLFHC
ncbi:hypothetical protein HanIR_Chr03g0118651 [Helianthus annuus]|nr:hypothetical protein HanIR_Chr03g0118651 [Helianthus annuus]